ncbi:restriction endonuclease subunit R [candidate division LCP-89 bacterium B3_LCP]|uniref:Type I restriction enzyme endonuclease subunit n=1 Tax=candidate division LCP-89 bacterium B3_LCP TaxID=2012998 RepID=A0A532V1U4_UNCL8|nr:MAG: restriction endonuclease subunit R [candidate division LCP-89 bacterium B3_LCP]
MSEVGQREILTQAHVVKFFDEELDYKYIGNWENRLGNSNVEEEYLIDWLKRQGHSDRIIEKVLRELDKAKTLGGSKTLYDANREVYTLLRYGIKVRPEVSEQYITVWLIDWENINNNDFAIAEEVTVAGDENNKRPDIVLYVNGIALGVLELKRSTVSVTEGIRQNLDSQKKEFIKPFFTTIQLVMAGNDTEGLRYGVIETPEKYYLKWKEDSTVENPLDRALGQLCRKDRLLEIIYNFMVFDAGKKKICRHNQYFGVRAAQEHVRRREAGIIWHTQGSGKSLTMVWLAKWIRERVTNSRVLIITDRTELDEQIEKVFMGVDEDIYRTRSGTDLVNVLNVNEEWLVCSLIHKFGRSDEADIDAFLKDIEKHLPHGFRAKGELFVFVDECHRTQSGKFNQAMKAIVPGAMLIGFTGTPLLKRDKKTSIEVFGPYIHTYKYDEAVLDGVVLDLRYEARDIDQNITSQDKVDQWFDIKTRGLSDLAKAQLKQRWGTMQKVLSAQDRLEKIIADILIDMETQDRLRSGHGNAMLVSGSIYSACRFFEMFQRTDLAGKCAIITSYKPSSSDIKGEETGEGQTEKLLQYDIYRKMLATHFDEPEETAMHKVEQFDKDVKKRFIEEPGQMKLLIVVDKLLTGFDAPPATYLYIDKHMHDHGLFQAICRVNRLDGEDKEYGYVIDYKDLFKSLEKSIKDYTGEAFDAYDLEDVQGLLKDRLDQARERLEECRESIKALCETVEPPRDTAAYLRFFCTADSMDGQALKDNEPKRVALYKMTSAFLRAYANLANEMPDAGYSDSEAQEIKAEVSHYEKVREEVKLASGDYIDMKMYEPAMRHLLDTYIRAEESEILSEFDDMTLVELIVERGEDAVKSLPKDIRENQEAMSETIENNVRRLIIDEMAVNPKYYEKMSELLDALIQARKKEALDYKAYLAKIVELTKKVSKPETQSTYPSSINTSALRALYDNLDENENIAVQIDTAIRTVKKAGWRGNKLKEREVRNAIKSVLGDDASLIENTFEIVKNQRDY